MNYDSKCEDLARHFYPHWPDGAIAQLAEDIQDAVEGIEDADGNPASWWYTEDPPGGIGRSTVAATRDKAGREEGGK